MLLIFEGNDRLFGLKFASKKEFLLKNFTRGKCIRWSKIFVSINYISLLLIQIKIFNNFYNWYIISNYLSNFLLI